MSPAFVSETRAASGTLSIWLAPQRASQLAHRPRIGDDLGLIGEIDRNGADDLLGLLPVSCLQRRSPIVEGLLLNDAHGNGHEGVVLAAQLGALAEIDAFFHGLEPCRRDAA